MPFPKSNDNDLSVPMVDNNLPLLQQPFPNVDRPPSLTKTPPGNLQFMSLLGQGRVNQLGGTYINGRPLPFDVRLAIIRMSKNGIKPVRISKELQVSHGAVSKILNRYNETGSIQPGQIGGPNPRQRLPIQALKARIQQIRNAKPKITAVEVRQTLIQSGICHQANAPTTSAINRHLKSLRHSMNVAKGNEVRYIIENIPSSSSEDGPRFAENKVAGIISHSIDKILGCGSTNDFQQTTFERLKTIEAAAATSSLANSSSSAFSSSSDEENATISMAILSNSFHQQQAAGGAEPMDVDNRRSGILQQQQGNAVSLSTIRRARTSFSATQLRRLEAAFTKNIYPNPEKVDELVKLTGLNEEKVRTWFSNRRARSRKSLFPSSTLNHTNPITSASEPISGGLTKITSLTSTQQSTFDGLKQGTPPLLSSNHHGIKCPPSKAKVAQDAAECSTVLSPFLTKQQPPNQQQQLAVDGGGIPGSVSLGPPLDSIRLLQQLVALQQMQKIQTTPFLSQAMPPPLPQSLPFLHGLLPQFPLPFLQQQQAQQLMQCQPNIHIKTPSFSELPISSFFR